MGGAGKKMFVLMVAMITGWAGDLTAGEIVDLEAGGEEAAGDATDKDDEDDDGDDEDDKYRMVTGLDFSLWAGESETIYGPGISFGFVLVPDHFELTLALGAMTGKTWHMIPIEINAKVPFRVLEWMSLYLDLGPTILTKKTRDYTQSGWAISAGGGIELLPVGFDWGVFAEFDYNYRFTKHRVRQGEEDLPHTYGFSAGFNYRF